MESYKILGTEYKIVESGSSEGLTKKINEHLDDRWELKGSHQVVTKLVENLYNGQRQTYENYYSQTMVRKKRVKTS